MPRISKPSGVLAFVVAAVLPGGALASAGEMHQDWANLLPGLPTYSRVAADGSGGVFVAGGFADTLNLGCGALVPTGGRDVFLAHYDTNGVCLWSSSYGGPGWDEITNLAIDSAGNVILAGKSSVSIDLGGGTLAGPGVFLVKLAPYGQHVWSQMLPDVEPKGMTTDSGGNIVITGRYRGPVDFGGGALPSSDWNYYIFVVKFDSAGVHQWSRGYGGPGQEAYGYGIAVDQFDNIVMTGGCQGVDFGGGPLAVGQPTSVFLVKLDSTGQHVWSRSTVSEVEAGNSWGFEVAVDRDGRIVVVGTFIGKLNLGPGDPNVGWRTVITGIGNPWFYLALFESSGEYKYGMELELPTHAPEPPGGYFGGVRLALDGPGHIYVVGVTYEPPELQSPATWWWFNQFHGYYGSSMPGGVNCFDLVSDPLGNLYLTGELSGAVDFGGGPIYSRPNRYDGYVVKLGQIDTDEDSIANEIDTQPIDYSSDFSDVSLGGTTSGRIASRGRLCPECWDRITVTDEAAPRGVRIAVTFAFQPDPMGFNVCGVGVNVDPGESEVVTCSSVQADVESGPIDAFLGPAVSAVVPTGASMKMHALGDGQSEISCLPGSAAPIDVSVNGVVTPLGAGESVTADIPEGAPVCQLSADFLDFGEVAVGGSAERTFVIRNAGASILSGAIPDSCGRFVADAPEPFHIAAGESLIVVERFWPDSAGEAHSLLDLGTGPACADLLLHGDATDPTSSLGGDIATAPGTALLGFLQSQPNPFSPGTSISFEVGHPGRVSLVVYDVAGARVRKIVDRELRPGRHTMQWDGRDSQGREATSGVYIYRLTAGGSVVTRRAVLLK